VLLNKEADRTILHSPLQLIVINCYTKTTTPFHMVNNDEQKHKAFTHGLLTQCTLFTEWF